MCDIYGALGTVGSRRESLVANFNIHGILAGLDCHRCSVGGQHGSGETSGVIHDFTVIQDRARPIDGSTWRDTHIPAVDRGENTIKSDGGSSVDSEVLTEIVGDGLVAWTAVG
jgi:hypothetical protein